MDDLPFSQLRFLWPSRVRMSRADPADPIGASKNSLGKRPGACRRLRRSTAACRALRISSSVPASPMRASPSQKARSPKAAPSGPGARPATAAAGAAIAAAAAVGAEGQQGLRFDAHIAGAQDSSAEPEAVCVCVIVSQSRCLYSKSSVASASFLPCGLRESSIPEGCWGSHPVGSEHGALLSRYLCF